MAIVFGSPEALKIRDADIQTEGMYRRHGKQFLLIAEVISRFGDVEKLREVISSAKEMKKLNAKLNPLEADLLDIDRELDKARADQQTNSPEYTEGQSERRDLQREIDEICRSLIQVEHTHSKTHRELSKLSNFNEMALQDMTDSVLLCYYTLPDREKHELTLIALGRKEAGQ